MLVLTRNENESWLECALRYAKPYGMEHEVKEYYDEFIANGSTEENAAFDACLEWDLLDYKKDDK